MRLRDDPLAHVQGVVEPDGQRFDSLRFTCPAHGVTCLILVRFTRDRPFFKLNDDVNVWHADGEFPDTFTLTPSVHVQDGPKGARTTHWHGCVTNGSVG